MVSELIGSILMFIPLLFFLHLQRKSEVKTKELKREIFEVIEEQNERINKQNEIFKKHTESLEHVKEIFRRESQK